VDQTSSPTSEEEVEKGFTRVKGTISSARDESHAKPFNTVILCLHQNGVL
jgi:hypothetical protein